MNHARLCIAAGGCFLIAMLASAGTTTRKPGLWEITTATTWQRAPQIPGTETGGLPGGSHTTDVCLTQEMIDDYGALLPHGNGQCKVENRATTESRTTGDYVCNGMMEGRGKIDSVWTDPEHVTGKLHFTGTFQIGGEKQPVEWTTETLSHFKGASCGAVKPHPLPK